MASPIILVIVITIIIIIGLWVIYHVLFNKFCTFKYVKWVPLIGLFLNPYKNLSIWQAERTYKYYWLFFIYHLWIDGIIIGGLIHIVWK